MVVDLTYFADYPNFMPNSGSSGNGNSRRLDEIEEGKRTSFINRYEAQYLKKILGVDLYNAFKAGYEATPPIAEKWTELAEALADSTNKISPIANYVQVWYLRRVDISDTGVVGSKTDNSVRLDPTDLIVQVWNEMVPLNIEFAEWLEDNRATYEVDDIEIPCFVEGEGLLAKINAFGI